MTRNSPFPLAVVFDLDGLLLDTQTSWAQAESAVFARYGHEFTAVAEREMLGLCLQAAGEALERFLGQEGRAAALSDELFELLLADVRANARPMKGAAELVSEINGRLSVAVASNSPREVLLAALRRAGMESAFAVKVSADDVARPKPAPDVYVRACQELGVEPRQSVAMEDSPPGVAAARAAGLTVVGVPSIPGVALDADVVAESLDDESVRLALSLPIR